METLERLLLAHPFLAGIDPATAKTVGYLRTETGPAGYELDTYVYPGGHEPPAAVPGLVVAFFKRQTLPH